MHCDVGGEEGEMYDIYQWEDTFSALNIGIMALQKLGSFSPHILHYIREGNGTRLQYSCLENPMDGGAW